jgi:hypothetical protein
MTLLGISVGQPSDGASFSRTCGTGYSIECHENQIRTDIGDPTFSFGANRRYYHDLGDAWPPDADGTTGRLNRDQLAGRLPFMSYKATVNWSSVTAGASDAALTTQGNDMRTWQLAHEGTNKWGATTVFYLHHEPNSSVTEGDSTATSYADAGAKWRAALEHIIELWKGLGVLIWDGTWSGGVLTTAQEGLMIGGLNLTWGESMNSVPNDWWPSSATWCNDNIVAPAADAYDRRAGNTTPDGTWDGLPYGFTWGANAFKDWTDAKRITQAALGRPLLPCILETNTEERSSYGSQDDGHWLGNGGTNPATKSGSYMNFANWIQSDWPDLFACNFWDSQASGVPFNFRCDSTTTAWTGWKAMVEHPVWELANSPTPPPFVPGELNLVGWAAVA